MEALHLIVVQHRDRRRGTRRIFQVAEIIPSYKSDNINITPSILYKEKPDGNIVAVNTTTRVFEALNMHTGMTMKEMEQEMKDKMKILNWLVNNNINTVNEVGKVVSEYYTNEDVVLKAIEQKKNPETIMRNV